MIEILKDITVVEEGKTVLNAHAVLLKKLNI